MSYSIFLNPLLFKNIANIGSVKHFVFVFKWTVGVMSQMGIQCILYIHTGCFNLYITFFLELLVSLSLYSLSLYDKRHRPLFDNISYEGSDPGIIYTALTFDLIFVMNERVLVDPKSSSSRRLLKVYWHQQLHLL